MHAMIVGLLLVTAPCAAAPPDDSRAVVESEFLFGKAAFAQCHASTIAEGPQGLVAAWFGGTREGHRDVGIWLARKINGRWTEPVEVANGLQPGTGKATPERFPCWNPVLFQPRQGPLLLFYKVGRSPRVWWTMLMSSTDGGRTWSTPRRLPEGQLGPVRNAPIQLPDGTLLCGASTENNGWKVHFERSPDLGKSWSRTGPVNDTRTFGVIQPTFLTYPDGRIQALCRSRQSVIVETWSTDGGKTWSTMSATRLPNPNSAIHGVTLQDGRHLLIYNHTIDGGKSPRDREMLNVAVSTDGKDWKQVLVLEREPNCEFSYPFVIQSRDGLVHVTYTWKRRRIKHVVLDPKRF